MVVLQAVTLYCCEVAFPFLKNLKEKVRFFSGEVHQIPFLGNMIGPLRGEPGGIGLPAWCRGGTLRHVGTPVRGLVPGETVTSPRPPIPKPPRHGSSADGPGHPGT